MSTNFPLRKPFTVLRFLRVCCIVLPSYSAKGGGIPVRSKKRLVALLLTVLGIGTLGVGYGILVNNGIGIPCLFYTVTGLRCPGCGISRALAALLCGRFNRLIEYNLFAPLIVLYLLWLGFFTAKRYIQTGRPAYSSPCRWIDIGVLVLLLFWWIARNLLHI